MQQEEHDPRIIHSLMLIKVRELLQRAFYQRDERTLWAIASMIGVFESELKDINVGTEIFESFIFKMDWHYENGIPLYIQRGMARPKDSTKRRHIALIFTSGFMQEMSEVMMFEPAIDGEMPMIERVFILPRDQCEVEIYDKPILTYQQLHSIALDVAKNELTQIGFEIQEIVFESGKPIHILALREGVTWGIAVDAAFYPNIHKCLIDEDFILAEAAVIGVDRVGFYFVGLINFNGSEEYFTHDLTNFTVIQKRFIPLAKKKPTTQTESSP